MLKQSSRKVYQLSRSISTASAAPGFVPEGKERYSSQSEAETKLFINGEFVKSSGTKFFEVRNPVCITGSIAELFFNIVGNPRSCYSCSSSYTGRNGSSC
jgi:hypothetical protein